MSFFESLLALLFAAVILLQVARRARLPYPSLLAIVGVGLAFVPGVPTIRIDPETALALFIAPVLLDAAYDFPLRSATRLWRPLAVLAVGAVLATTAVVAWIGVAAAGLPIAAAVVLGAIVAPPDAAAATAVTGSVTLPRRTVAVLKGESLLNDATALLLFGAALAIQTAEGSGGSLALRLTLAAPGGIALGLLLGWLMVRMNRLVSGTLGANILQFVNAFAAWIIAERLHLSAVLAVVACAVVVARSPQVNASPRMRVQSFAVWASVVFLLNVLAFLLMGMQARALLERLADDGLSHALEIAALVVVGVVAARFVVVMAWNLASRRWSWIRGGLEPPTVGQGVVTSWAGMRGLVTLATAFALPQDFPQRDLVVLAAFATVLATLAVQGLTLAPLIRTLGLDRLDDPDAEMRDARRALADAAVRAAGGEPDLAKLYGAKRAALDGDDEAAWLERHRQAALAIVAAQRDTLDRLRDDETIGIDTFYRLQEELDWRALTLLPEDQRRIEEV